MKYLVLPLLTTAIAALESVGVGAGYGGFGDSIGADVQGGPGNNFDGVSTAGDVGGDYGRFNSGRFRGASYSGPGGAIGGPGNNFGGIGTGDVGGDHARFNSGRFAQTNGEAGGVVGGPGGNFDGVSTAGDVGGDYGRFNSGRFGSGINYGGSSFGPGRDVGEARSAGVQPRSVCA